MKSAGVLIGAALIVVGLTDQSYGVFGGSDPRAMGLAQAYTAQVRGPESVFWNPANLGLSGGNRFAWELLGGGLTLVADNNAWSVNTYNDYFTSSNHNVSPRGTKYYIRDEDKRDLLDDVPGSGLKSNLEFEPQVALGIPINGGVAFPMPWGLNGALTLGLTSGFEGEVPRDMIELALFGNEFAADRVAAGKPKGYDITRWDGSGWILGSLNLAAARPWMPGSLAPYLSEFSVGATFKILGGGYAEVMKSGGSGLVARVSGADADAYLISQTAGGMGFGVDLGAAGVTKDGKTTLSAGLLNALDYISWGMGARQDSLFIVAHELRVTRAGDPEIKNIEDVLDNADVDGDGDVDFHAKLSEESFTRSLPAVLRLGVAHQVSPRLSVMGSYDQAFTTGFGMTTDPRLAIAAEYRMVPWFPVRCGFSGGGRRGHSSAVGMALGPFGGGRLRFTLLDLAWVTCGGFRPGAAQGTAISLRFLELALR